jgi:tight adherence protein B
MEREVTDVMASVGASASVLLAFFGIAKSLRRAEVARALGRWDPSPKRRRGMAKGRSLRERGNREPLLTGLAEAVARNRFGRKLAARAARLHPSRPFSDVLALWSSGAIGGVIAGWLLFGGPLPILLAGAAPLIIDRVMIRAGGRRTARLEQQLPQAFSLQSSALRAGNSLTATLRMMSHELPAPLGEELSTTVQETELGTDLGDALARMASRTASRDVTLWVTAMTVHRRTGGSLPKILESLANRIRERTQMRAEVRALTAQGRLSGLVVAGAPVGFFLLLSATSRDQMSVLYSSPLGLTVLALGVAFQLLGFVWVRRILKLPE